MRKGQVGGQRGFSLVELMIAMLLGVVVVAGLIQVLIANRKAYQLQEGNNYLQQNLRYASDRLNWSLRMAGFWGGAASADVAGESDAASAVTAGGGDCTKDWIVDVSASNAGGGSIAGYDGAQTFPLGDCVETENYVKGSDVLVVRYAGTQSLDPAGAATIAADGYAVHLVATVGRQASLFQGDTPPVIGVSPPPLRYVFPFNIDVYYLRPCSDPGTNAKCDATDDEGTPVPTLMRMHLDSTGALVSEPLVGGIEQLQFQYGVSAEVGGSGDVFPSQYLSATDVTAGNQWASVVAVKVSMVSRGNLRDVTVPHTGTYALTPGCRYAIATDGAFTPPAVATSTSSADCTGFTLTGLTRPDQFQRSQSQQVVQVRNRTRG